jgi:hypothetical protein
MSAVLQNNESNINRASQYLTARKCAIDKTTGSMIEFRLDGETSNMPGGRMSVAKDGSVKIWHRYAQKGLAAGTPWEPAGTTKVGEKQIPMLKTHIDDLSIEKDMPALERQSKFVNEPVQKKIYNPEQVRSAADQSLQACGLVPSSVTDRYADAPGGKAVIKLLVSDDGVASVFSFRDDINLPSPWREGRPNKLGHKTMFATGKDLGLDGQVITANNYTRPNRSSFDTPKPIDLDLNRDTYLAWKAGHQPPPDHRHLTKNNAVLDGSGLRVYPPGHAFAGTMIAPMFRPDPGGSNDKVQLCGVHHMMPKLHFDNTTDKIMAKGSITAGAFVPLPSPNALMQNIGENALAPLQPWIDAADKSKPLVICEGIATGLAIGQTGAGNALCTLSSTNTMIVSHWVKNSGLSEHFPAVIIATDHDIRRDETGKLVSKAIPTAAKAAEETGFLLAIPPAGSGSGTDARDLLGKKGEQAVRDLIANAASAEEVKRQRAEIFLPGKPAPVKDTELER